MRDQQPKFISSTDSATNTPLKITRLYRDFAPPGSSSGVSRRGGSGNLDARSLGTSRLQGPRLELAPAVRARIEANRRSRGAAAAGAGRMLRATGGRGRGGGDGGDGRRGGREGGAGGGRNQRRRENVDFEAEGDSAASREADAKIEAHFGPPPREWVDHVPEELSLADLRVDWPSIPTGKIGMVTGLEEKLRWAARRMQHGYESPHELAERLHRGQELVHFESEQEKEQTLEIARGLAQRAADQRTERTGLEVKPTHSSFAPIRDKDRVLLARDFIRGEYPPIEAGVEMRKGKGEAKEAGRGKTPAFLTDVVRMLANNETYHAKEKEQLVSTIQGLLSTTQRRVRLQSPAGPGP